MTDLEDLESLTRRELQTLAKQYNIKANQKNVVLIEALRACLHRDESSLTTASPDSTAPFSASLSSSSSFSSSSSSSSLSFSSDTDTATITTKTNTQRLHDEDKDVAREKKSEIEEQETDDTISRQNHPVVVSERDGEAESEQKPTAENIHNDDQNSTSCLSPSSSSSSSSSSSAPTLHSISSSLSSLSSSLFSSSSCCDSSSLSSLCCSSFSSSTATVTASSLISVIGDESTFILSSSSRSSSSSVPSESFTTPLQVKKHRRTWSRTPVVVKSSLGVLVSAPKNEPIVSIASSFSSPLALFCASSSSSSSSSLSSLPAFSSMSAPSLSHSPAASSVSSLFLQADPSFAVSSSLSSSVSASSLSSQSLSASSLSSTPQVSSSKESKQHESSSKVDPSLFRRKSINVNASSSTRKINKATANKDKPVVHRSSSLYTRDKSSSSSSSSLHSAGSAKPISEVPRGKPTVRRPSVVKATTLDSAARRQKTEIAHQVDSQRQRQGAIRQKRQSFVAKTSSANSRLQS